MKTKSSGFTLIELLVVVAIIGILAGVGIVSYNGYVTGSKKKTSESVVLKISLAQQEYYSENGEYYPSTTSTSCTPSSSTSAGIDTDLLDNSTLVTDISYLEVCAWRDGADNYGVVGSTVEGCIIEANSNSSISRSGGC